MFKCVFSLLNNFTFIIFVILDTDFKMTQYLFYVKQLCALRKLFEWIWREFAPEIFSACFVWTGSDYHWLIIIDRNTIINILSY